jgi:hypothetical protein
MSDISSQTGEPGLKQPHHSDGSELVPAEVQVNERHNNHDAVEPVQSSAVPGSTIDDEGLLNNFAVEPKVLPLRVPFSPPATKLYFLGHRSNFAGGFAGINFHFCELGFLYKKRSPSPDVNW